ncbi:MAG: ABC transporter substrate-binding protein [Deltaproteobacteria bacterium]|nr:ABC transporter substrate-binding protein [Deltaproteobacteria bacterium]
MILPGTFHNSIRIAAILIFAALLLCGIGSSPSHGAKACHIAVVLTDDSKPYNEALSGFYEGLKAGNIDCRASEYVLNGENRQEIIAALVSFKPDFVHTIGTTATRITRDKIKDRPIIFSMALNPVASGLVKSMKSSGNNLTGASLDVPHLVQFKRIKKKLPSIRRIGVLYSEVQTGVVVADAERAADALGIKLVKARIESPADVPRELNKLIGKIDILWSVADTQVFTRETLREILLVTLRNKIPLVGPGPSFVRSGALFAFNPDEKSVGRQAAIIAEKVLAGKKPSQIPVTAPEKVELMINEDIFDVLGVDIKPD